MIDAAWELELIREAPAAVLLRLRAGIEWSASLTGDLPSTSLTKGCWMRRFCSEASNAACFRSQAARLSSNSFRRRGIESVQLAARSEATFDFEFPSHNRSRSHDGFSSCFLRKVEKLLPAGAQRPDSLLVGELRQLDDEVDRELVIADVAALHGNQIARLRGLGGGSRGIGLGAVDARATAQLAL